MESARLHSALRRNRLRCLRTSDIGDARAAFADPFFERPLKEFFARLSHLCACTELDLFAATLAQFLECLRSQMSQARGSRYVPSLGNLAPCEFWSQVAPVSSDRILPRSCSPPGTKSSSWTTSMIFTIRRLSTRTLPGSQKM